MLHPSAFAFLQSIIEFLNSCDSLEVLWLKFYGHYGIFNTVLQNSSKLKFSPPKLILLGIL